MIRMLEIYQAGVYGMTRRSETEFCRAAMR